MLGCRNTRRIGEDGECARVRARNRHLFSSLPGWPAHRLTDSSAMDTPFSSQGAARFVAGAPPDGFLSDGHSKQSVPEDAALKAHRLTDSSAMDTQTFASNNTAGNCGAPPDGFLSDGHPPRTQANKFSTTWRTA